MADIKTRDTLKGTVKTLDKAVVGTQKVKHAYISTKDKAEQSVDPKENNANEYAIDQASEGAKKTAQKGAQVTKKAAKKGSEKVKDQVEKRIQKQGQKRVEKQAESRIRTTANKSIRTAEQTEKTIRQSATSAGNKTIKTIKTTGRQSAKTVQRSVKTAEKTSKAAIKTAKQSAKAAQKAAKASAKAAQKSAQAAKAAAKATAKAIKVTIKALIAAIKAIAAGIKALVAAIAAGGWVAVVVIIVLCLVGLIVGSAFGILTPPDAVDSGLTIQQAVQQINSDWEQHLETEKKNHPHDNLVIEGEKAKWKEVIAIYAVKKNMGSANPDEVVTMSEEKLRDLEYIFWEMNHYSSRVESKTVKKTVEEKDKDGKVKKVTKYVTEKTLYITITHRDLDSMMNRNCFTDEMKKMCRELLNDKYNSLWTQLLSGISYDDNDIVKLAQDQLGNSGNTYWSWYGFPSRVEWCACFVSWCGAQCGYTDEGVFPKYSVCDDGVNFFKSKGGWLGREETPQPGMVIFFDWADDGLDGNSDHTGIVEKVENGVVYTIEGNSGDKVCENQYNVGNREILGYGTYQQHENSVSGDVATQVWKHLKSYGFSDSVAAGIIGNMMRECGGDTLDLDWDIVGHYGGSEFYGLCQWCLDYTPSGFKGSSIKQQCEYLKKTIKSEFATYGGNYNGITYEQFLKSDTRTAAIAFERVYERCGDYSNEDTRRANNAAKAYSTFHE